MIADITSNLKSLTTAIGTLGAFVTLIYNLKQARRNHDEIVRVHQLVNDRATKQDNRIDQLTQSLQTSDTAVPPRKNGYPIEENP
jgi:hypothetical protein